MRSDLAVIIPAYNAERTVGNVVIEARRQHEPVIVIDDGSVDKTGDAARAAGAAVVLRHDVNRGKGAALKTGFAWALDNEYSAVITLDADGQHLASEIPKFIEQYARGGEDLIIGGRAHLFMQMLPRRRNANRFSAWCIAKCSGADITDSQSGFRLYSARLLRALKLRADRFDMESEVIVLAAKRKLRIVTIPIELGFVDGLATSHFRPLVDTLRIAWTVTRAKFLW
ncbi:MAG: glycosyltransferase family 2 protein [Acidobacteria bacterium]|nr:MAG: glycosyltransferase family 2 protein [Acidobacteriota bacterium]